MRHFCIEALHALIAIIGVVVAIPPAVALDYDAAMKASQAALGRVVGDYPLTDTDGRRVRLTDFRGKPLLVSFIDTGCSQVCPTTTKFLDKAVRQAAGSLGDDAFNVVTIGFNLPFDNPAAMWQFARQQGIDRVNWRFMSPDPGSASALTDEFGFAHDTSASGFDHIAQLTLVDANGRIARQLYGDTFEPALLTASLREAITGVPAPAQSLRRLVDRVRVLCSV